MKALCALFFLLWLEIVLFVLLASVSFCLEAVMVVVKCISSGAPLFIDEVIFKQFVWFLRMETVILLCLVAHPVWRSGPKNCIFDVVADV